MIPIRYVVLEGPDCSGKTSLYSEVHKATGFRYNIHDRSFLSMLCYARLYGRDESEHRRRLREELCDINNFLVVLMPPEAVVVQRLRDRGDEFQDEESLLKLYRIFQEEVENLDGLPNVLVIRRVADLTTQSVWVSHELEEYSKQSPGEVGRLIKSWTSLSPNAEVQLRCSFDVPLTHRDPAIMNEPGESEYYHEILRKCEDVILNEVSGKNPYGVPQDSNSRRFFYSSDTCISSIHFMLRDKTLDVHCNLRSTDAVKNGSIDLRFLTHLSAIIPKTFSWEPRMIRLNVSFNSLHVRRDAV